MNETCSNCTHERSDHAAGFLRCSVEACGCRLFVRPPTLAPRDLPIEVEVNHHCNACRHLIASHDEAGRCDLCDCTIWRPGARSPDDLESLIAESMNDPAFTAAFREAEAKNATVRIPRDLAEELLGLLHDLAGHQRVTQGEVSPGVVRCADALRAVLSSRTTTRRRFPVSDLPTSPSHRVSIITGLSLDEADRFVWKASWQSRPALIDHIEVMYINSVALSGYALKNDGTPGKQRQSGALFYDEEPPTPVVAAVRRAHLDALDRAKKAADCDS